MWPCCSPVGASESLVHPSASKKKKTKKKTRFPIALLSNCKLTIKLKNPPQNPQITFARSPNFCGDARVRPQSASELSASRWRFVTRRSIDVRHQRSLH